MADLESGVWAGDQFLVTESNTPIHAEFVTAMLKGDSGNHWALKGGDAQQGELKTLFDGPVHDWLAPVFASPHLGFRPL